MNNYLSLTKILFKNSLSSINDAKSNKKSTKIIYLILAICFIPTIFTIYFFFNQLFELLSQLNQEGLVISLGLQMTSILIFFFSLFLIPSIYYFSKDINTLLALPLKPQTIIISKFTICIFYEYLFVAVILIPLFIAYAQYNTISLLFIIFALLCFITIPFYPLILSSLFTMILMRFAPFMKRRDTFNIIGNLLVIVAAFSFSYAMQGINSINPEQMVTLLSEGNNSLISMISYLLPTISFITKALVNLDFISCIIYLGMIIIALVIFAFAANKLYFQGVIGVEESSSSRKMLSKSNLSKSSKQNNILLTYIKKEFRIIFRTPAFLMNCVISALIPPIMVIIFIISSKDVIAKLISDDLITQIIAQDNFIFYIMIAALIVGCVIGNLNLIAATSISREGSNYTFMKYIPVSINTQINAKVMSGIITSFITNVLLIIPIYIIFPISILYYIIFLILTTSTCILANYLGILIDLYHPKLVWEQEASAVKQNLGGAIAIFAGMGSGAAIGFACFLAPTHLLPIIASTLSIMVIILCILTYKYVNKIAAKIFKNL